jgi:hypothetical protein
MAAMNKSSAQNNKFHRGRSAPAVDDGDVFSLLPCKLHWLRTRIAPPSCSDLPIPGRLGMNPSHHGSDEQMFGSKQQVLHRGLGD